VVTILCTSLMVLLAFAGFIYYLNCQEPVIGDVLPKFKISGGLFPPRVLMEKLVSALLCDVSGHDSWKNLLAIIEASVDY
jgi:hypothetical protein